MSLNTTGEVAPPPKPSDRAIIEWLAFCFTICTALILAVLFIAGKASNERVDELEARVHAGAIVSAELRAELRWLVSSVASIAQRVGAPVPPPPTP